LITKNVLKRHGIEPVVLGKRPADAEIFEPMRVKLGERFGNQEDMFGLE
jgi:hypothetical protein